MEDTNLASVTHKIRAMMEMMAGNRISVIHAITWDDVRLSATIHALQLEGVPIDFTNCHVENPLSGTALHLRHWFINFGLLGDKGAAIERKIERKVRTLGRIKRWEAAAEQLLIELNALGWQPTEEQLGLF